MRSSDQVQRAHDILHAVVAREVDISWPEEFLDIAHGVHDALSWVLEGPCGDTFSKGLEGLRYELEQAGYVLVRRQ